MTLLLHIRCVQQSFVSVLWAVASGIHGKVLRYCTGFVGNESTHMISYNTEDGRMCDHHAGIFKAKFSFCMSRILASHGVHDPHTVTNMINYQVPFLIGP